VAEADYAPDEKCTLRGQISETGLNIIAKVASIELTHEKSSYQDDCWTSKAR
jgi:hypothetical protein